jgi:hypothetical protein
MRASFELKLEVSNLMTARLEAYKHIGAFIECDPSEVADKVDIELKVKTLDTSDSSKPKWSEETDLYEVTVYGTLKQSVIRPL